MTFDIRTSRRCQREISRIALWYDERSGEKEVGDRWLSGLDVLLESLAEDPARHPVAREANDLGEDVREIHYGSGQKKTHRILFRIHDNHVEVIGVRHTAQRDLTADDL